MGCSSVESQTWLTASKILRVVAQGFTLASSITEWNSAQVYIWIGIRSDQSKYIVATAAQFVE